MTQLFGVPDPGRDLTRWMAEARAGSAEALGRLLQACRQYLLLVANRELAPEIRGKVGPSDLVQETFLRAHGAFARFEGRTEAELLAWLRRILVNALVDASRRPGCREAALDTDDTVAALENGAADPGPSPSSDAREAEEAAEVERVLARLPELQRRVVRWRNWERLPFKEIGRRAGLSAGAARKVWARALDQLKDLLGPSHEP